MEAREENYDIPEQIRSETLPEQTRINFNGLISALSTIYGGFPTQEQRALPQFQEIHRMIFPIMKQTFTEMIEDEATAPFAVRSRDDSLLWYFCKHTLSEGDRPIDEADGDLETYFGIKEIKILIAKNPYALVWGNNRFILEKFESALHIIASRNCHLFLWVAENYQFIFRHPDSKQNAAHVKLLSRAMHNDGLLHIARRIYEIYPDGLLEKGESHVMRKAQFHPLFILLSSRNYEFIEWAATQAPAALTFKDSDQTVLMLLCEKMVWPYEYGNSTSVYEEEYHRIYKLFRRINPRALLVKTQYGFTALRSLAKELNDRPILQEISIDMLRYMYPYMKTDVHHMDLLGRSAFLEGIQEILNREAVLAMECVNLKRLSILLRRPGSRVVSETGEAYKIWAAKRTSSLNLQIKHLRTKEIPNFQSTASQLSPFRESRR